MRTLILCVVALSAAVSCRAHVELGEIPDVNASLEDRAAAYERLKPQQQLVRTAYQPVPALMLADGDVVQDARDLAPAVKPGSSTARHAASAEQLAETGGILEVTGTTVALLGLTALVGLDAVGTLELTNVAPQPAENTAMIVAALGTAGLSIAGLAIALPGVFVQLAANDERQAAFATYDHDLRARLALVRKKAALTETWESE